MFAKIKCNSHDSMNDNKNPGIVLLMQREDATALLYADPHNPMRHLQRGILHSQLGYPDLAAADAYRALTLFEAMIDPDSSEYRPRKKVGLDAVELISSSGLVDRDTSMNVHVGAGGSDYGEPESYDDDVDQNGHMEEDEEEEEGFEPISQDEYTENICNVYILLVKSLVQCGCMRDAYGFCIQAMSLQDSELKSSFGIFEEQLAIIKRSITDRQRSGQQTEKCGDSTNNQDLETEAEMLARFQPSDLSAQGRAKRVLYPWNTYEPDR
ncbi:hypothetical protein I7I51_03801 [Histoplasma capsulatum]|uniref:Uncharacterized protein n=1 Tax=Ajellomyces capsulatus TaxID=5037 RepID=A0A8A1MAI3_AJECA|nr:hypothetical protein I7I51_03801 [Histoplasma capsulatum]